MASLLKDPSLNIKDLIIEKYGEPDNFKQFWEKSYSIEEMAGMIATEMKQKDPDLTYLMSSSYAEALLFSNQLNQKEKDYAESRSGRNFWKNNNLIASSTDLVSLIKKIPPEKMKILKEKYKGDIMCQIFMGIDETNVRLREVFNFWELQNIKNKLKLTKKDVDRINYLQGRIDYYDKKREKYTKLIQEIISLKIKKLNI